MMFFLFCSIIDTYYLKLNQNSFVNIVTIIFKEFYMNRIKLLIYNLNINLRYYTLQLSTFGLLLFVEIMMGIGDFTIFLVFPELFIYFILAQFVTILWKRIYPVFMKNRFIISSLLCCFSIIIFLNYFKWIQPF